MFPMGFPSWAWDWGWGWAAAVGGIILLGIFLIPWFFFLLNLQNLLNRVSDHNRAMPAGYVWLNFIPIFNLGWFIYTVTKVRDSVKAEYRSRNWVLEGDFAYNVGLAAGVLAIVTFFMGEDWCTYYRDMLKVALVRITSLLAFKYRGWSPSLTSVTEINECWIFEGIEDKQHVVYVNHKYWTPEQVACFKLLVVAVCNLNDIPCSGHVDP